jgi:hypothetical protein
MKVFESVVLPCLAIGVAALTTLWGANWVRVEPTSRNNTSLTFTTIDVPGAAVTEITGINSSGELVGFYGQNVSEDIHGFVYTGGNFTYFDYPGLSVTVPNGINDSGVIVGYATQLPSLRSSVVGFTYDGSSFTTLKDASDQATYGYGINNIGVVVGNAGSLDYTRGFRMRNGRYTALHFPGTYFNASGTGINNHNVLVGYTVLGGVYNAYVYAAGAFTNIDVSGAQATSASAINDSGIVVGWYNPVSTNYYYGFAWKNGTTLTFGVPGAVWTAAYGINAFGQIVGAYSLDDGVTWHGFLTNPVALPRPR